MVLSYEIGYRLYENHKLKQLHKLLQTLQYYWILTISKYLSSFLGLIRFNYRFIFKKAIYQFFYAEQTIDESLNVVSFLSQYNCYSALYYVTKAKETIKVINEVLNVILKIILIAHNNSNIPFIVFKMSSILPNFIPRPINKNIIVVTPRKITYQKCIKRLHKTFELANELKIPVIIDTEKNWIQDSIDKITYELMLKYNKKQSLVIPTIQLYQKDGISKLKQLLDFSRSNQLFACVKLFQGTYLDKEHSNSKKNGYISTLFHRKEDTAHNFNKAIEIFISNLDILTVVIANHNININEKTIPTMQMLGIEKSHSKAWFSQLYRVDYIISMNFSNNGYKIVKYVPYGTEEESNTLFNTSAEENTTMLQQRKHKLMIIIKDLNFRKFL